MVRDGAWTRALFTHSVASFVPARARNMYFVGTALPHTPAADGPSWRTIQLTRAQKTRLVDIIDQRDLAPVPLCIDHGDASADAVEGGSGLYVLSPKYIIGRVIGGMVGANGNLLLVGAIDALTPEALRVLSGIRDRGERWGLSLGTDIAWDSPDEYYVRDKRVSHVGVTLDPAYGPEGSFFHDIATSLQAILDVLANYLVDPGVYAPTRLRELVSAARQGAYYVPPGQHRVDTGGGTYITMTAMRDGSAPSLSTSGKHAAVRPP